MFSQNTESSIPYIYAGSVIAVSTALPAAGTLLTVLRFWLRRRSKETIGPDDWLLLPALVFEWGMAITLLIGVSIGVVGYPMPPAPNNDVDVDSDAAHRGWVPLHKIEYSFFVLMIACFGFIKLSVLYFYRRVFVVGRSRFNTVTMIAVMISGLWLLTFLLLQIFTCGKNPYYYWSSNIEYTTHCVRGLNFYLSLAVVDLATDIMIFFLPLPLLWRLQMTTARKISVTLIVTLGAVSLVASAVRLSLHVAQFTGGYSKSTDTWLDFTIAFYWSLLEAGIAIVAVNLPNLKSLVGMRSVQSLVGSVRSVISISSLRSHAESDASRTYSDSTRVVSKTTRAHAKNEKDESVIVTTSQADSDRYNA